MSTPSLPRLVLALVVAVSAAPAFAQVAGISPTEIRVATLQDLSGPLSGPGKQVMNGMRMRVEEINAQGGIHGRKITLLVEDHGYDPKKAVLATEKLFGRDGAMLMAGQIGTATTLATVPLLTQKNVINFFPLTSAREVYEPPTPLKFAFLAPYFLQLGTHTPRLAKQINAKKVCALYQDDEFGLEILRGAEAGLKEAGREMVEKTSYKRGATDFSSQVAKLAAANCDLVVLGTVVRETVGVMTEARKLGFKPVFLGSPGAYSSAVVDLGGKDVEGLYVTMTVEQPYVDSGPPELRRFASGYKTKFAEDATVFSSYGYLVIDLFAQAAQKAGANLTNETFTKALETGSLPATPYGTGELTFTPTKRLGSEVARLSQIRNGRWVVVD
ncbi:ABC transporter substrate-binding protein [Hydrogenophaga palleronii]|uniref:ABC transporter substrate-binding protein n=1 Tax=Hydrogenophaga palleronii TaxID=65655 RepID=UPI00082629D1|nr:ABC transporter substrate-binding protein [Hydrogenophaga palleronii]